MDTNPNPFQDALPFYDKLTSLEKTPELQLIEQETAEQVELMIRELPDKYKTLIVYKYF